VESVDSPAAGASLVDTGGGDVSEKVSGGDSANPAAAISLQAYARRKATASGVSRISAELKKLRYCAPTLLPPARIARRCSP